MGALCEAVGSGVGGEGFVLDAQFAELGGFAGGVGGEGGGDEEAG